MLFLLSTQVLHAQTVISGYVLSDQGDTLPGANVYIKDAFDGCSSGVSGNFKFSTSQTGNAILIASMVGYDNYEKAITLDGNPKNISIRLAAKANELNTVVITAGNFETGDVKKTAVLNSIDIATTAGATADIYGALKTLPGTMPAAEENGLFVRGGDAAETKTFFDGILISNPFTAELPDVARRGRFSPFMFKGTSFSSGAYSAQYGQALSSTMQLDSKDIPGKTKSDIGIMTAGLDATHTRRFKNSSLEAQGSYYNLKPIFSIVEQNTEWTKEPESVHGSAFYKLKTGTGLFKIYGSMETGVIGLKMDNLNDITKESIYKIKNYNGLINATWQQPLGEKWKLQTGIGYQDDNSRINIDGANIRQHESSIHAKATVTRYLGKLSDVKAGVEYFGLSGLESYDEKSHSFYNPVIAGFAESNIYFTKSLMLRLGARYEHDNLLEQSSLAPRASVAYKVTDASQWSAGYGRFYQTPANDFLFEPGNLGFENADHYVLSYQYQVEKRTCRVEAYYKKYDNQVKTGSNKTDNSGYGYAAGIDFFWRDTKTFRYGDYWVTYSFLDTKRLYRDFPVEATPEFAAKHVANAVYKYFFAKLNCSIGATYTYASGRPYFNPNSSGFLTDKTKDYHNFSMNVARLTSIAKKFTVIYVSVENIFGINNVFGYHYSPDGSVRKPIVPSAPRTIFAGVFITFGDDQFKY